MKKKNQWDEAAITNNRIYGHYLSRLYELSISMFEWKGLPDTIDPRYLEVALFWNGTAIVFIDEVMGPLGLQCVPSSQWDQYGYPVYREAYGSNGYRRPNLTKDDSVMIYNNMIHTNSAPMIQLFSKRLYDLDQTVDINARAMKTPVILQGDENTRLSLKNIWMSYAGNEPMMVVDKGFSMDSVKVLDLKANFIAPQVHELKCSIWNEALTYLGIANIELRKQERMLVDEVMSLQGGVLASRNSRLKTRMQACEKMNRLFGWDCSVEYNQYVEGMTGMPLAQTSEGVLLGE